MAKTLEFLVGNLASIKESPRSLAIMTFILHRHTHPYIELKQTLFQSLRSKAITTSMHHDIFFITSFVIMFVLVRWGILILAEWETGTGSLVCRHRNQRLLSADISRAQLVHRSWVHSEMVGSAAQIKRGFCISSGDFQVLKLQNAINWHVS